MNVLQTIQILEAQNVPMDWTSYLIIMPVVAAIIRWILDCGDLSNLELVYTLIQNMTEEITNKINIIQAFINNGFVHTNLPLDITRTYAYLTEFIRSTERVVFVFGILIDTLEVFGLPQDHADNCYVDLQHALLHLTELYNQLGNQLHLVTIQTQ